MDARFLFPGFLRSSEESSLGVLLRNPVNPVKLHVLFPSCVCDHLWGDFPYPFSSETRADYPEYHEWLELVFKPVGFSPQIAEEHDSGSSLIAAIEARRGIALVLSCFACLVGPRLRLKELHPAPTPFIVGAAYNPSRLCAVARKFLALTRQLRKANGDVEHTAATREQHVTLMNAGRQVFGPKLDAGFLILSLSRSARLLFHTLTHALALTPLSGPLSPSKSKRKRKSQRGRPSAGQRLTCACSRELRPIPLLWGDFPIPFFGETANNAAKARQPRPK